MTYWRMQVHPDEKASAFRYSIESLSAGFIGLDFEYDVGDLRKAQKEQLPDKQKVYWPFAHEMKKGDLVLVIAHHFPVALATVSGDYNYIGNIEPELGVWFRHFRRVDNVRYYADLKTNLRDWNQLKMTETITPLRESDSKSYRLIETFLKNGYPVHEK